MSPLKTDIPSPHQTDCEKDQILTEERIQRNWRAEAPGTSPTDIPPIYTGPFTPASCGTLTASMNGGFKLIAAVIKVS